MGLFLAPMASMALRFLPHIISGVVGLLPFLMTKKGMSPEEAAQALAPKMKEARDRLVGAGTPPEVADEMVMQQFGQQAEALGLPQPMFGPVSGMIASLAGFTGSAWAGGKLAAGIGRRLAASNWGRTSGFATKWNAQAPGAAGAAATERATTTTAAPEIQAPEVERVVTPFPGAGTRESPRTIHPSQVRMLETMLDPFTMNGRVGGSRPPRPETGPFPLAPGRTPARLPAPAPEAPAPAARWQQDNLGISDEDMAALIARYAQ